MTPSLAEERSPLDAPPAETAPVVGWLTCSSGDVAPGEAWLSAPERDEAASFRLDVRRDAFRLRRWTGRRAVASRLGLAQDASALGAMWFRRDPLGAPTAWKDGARLPLSVSLSDRDGRAASVVGPAYLALGCDLELVEPRSPAFLSDFLTAREQAFVAAAADTDDRNLRAALLWSAKESALKALRVGLRRDTRSLEVAIGPAAARAGWFPLAVVAEEGRRFTGWWRRLGDLVLTVVASPAVAPPVPLGPAVVS